MKDRVATFFWNPKEATGVDSTIITHRQSIYNTVKPVQQKKRKFILERLLVQN